MRNVLTQHISIGVLLPPSVSDVTRNPEEHDGFIFGAEVFDMKAADLDKASPLVNLPCAGTEFSG